MKVSLSWLKELIDFNLSPKDLADKLSLTSIGVKEQTPDYLELDLTYNRGDLLSLRGVAREVAAITDSKLKFNTEKSVLSSQNQTGVEIEDEEICPIYCLAKIENLTSASSDPSWVKKLNDSGMRSVNNIADITNLVMLEYGQPMHAFDADKITGNIVVRQAKKGEKIQTLDEKQRTLSEKDLIIADNTGPIAIAGVMGGKMSEASEQTSSILLEAAIFDPVSIRNTSKRMGLYSESSRRFLHGLTKKTLLQALSAAIKIYEGLGGTLTGLTLKGNLEDAKITVQLTSEKINSLIGINIPAEEVKNSLEKLGFTLTEVKQGWAVTVPYWRKDIRIEEDLIEEVARIYGYEKIPTKELTGDLPEKLDQSMGELVYSIKKASADIGLTEVQSYTFYSTKVIENCKLKTENLIRISNPISTETEYLRDNLWSNLLEVTAKNLRNGIKDVAIFELGKVYLPKKGDLPEEPYHLAIALSNGTNNPIEELIGIAQSLGLHLEGGDVNMQHHLGGGPKVASGVHLRGELSGYFHPTRCAVLEKDGREVGFIAEIHPRIVNKFGIDQRMAVLEFRI